MPILRRLIGLLLIVAAVGGALFSIIAMITIWRIEPDLTTNLQNTITLLSETLETTSEGLVVTKEALRTSVDTIDNLQITMETTAETIESTNPLVDDIAELMNDELPNTIEATRQSLETAQQSAQVVDSLLGSLSRLPLIGESIGYNPEVPLAEALGEVGDSLEGLPESFASMEENLRTTQSNLETFQADLTVMASSVGQIRSNVARYEQVVDGYAASIDQVQDQLADLSLRIPSIARGLVLGLTFFLIWMLVAQLGLLTQGWELVTESVRREVVEEIKEQPSVVVVEEIEPGENDDRGAG